MKKNYPKSQRCTMRGHNIVIVKTPPVTLPTGARIERAILHLDVRPPISGIAITDDIQSVPVWNET